MVFPYRKIYREVTRKSSVTDNIKAFIDHIKGTIGCFRAVPRCLLLLSYCSKSKESESIIKLSP